MLLKEILKKVHEKVEKRPSENDSNFNYVHQEDVIELVKLAYGAQNSTSNNTANNRQRLFLKTPC